MGDYQFVYEGRTYLIHEIENQVLCSNGDLLSIQWVGLTPKASPFNPVARLNLNANFELSDIASSLCAAPATLVVNAQTKACPHFGHGTQTGNFCCECGAPTVFIPYTIAFEPISKHNFHLSVPADVQGFGPCPNCKTTLDHDHQLSTCPNCGQALHWACRSSKNPGHNANRNEI